MVSNRAWQFGEKDGICESCGQPIASHSRCTRCSVLTGSGHPYQMEGGLCNVCSHERNRPRGKLADATNIKFRSKLTSVSVCAIREALAQGKTISSVSEQ
jgi:hypothetical protein